MSRAETSQTPGASRRGTHVRVLALLGALAVLVGVGSGSVLAWWQDAEQVTARVPRGVLVLGAGAPGALEFATTTTPLPGGGAAARVSHAFGPAQAEALYNGNLDEGGAVAIPLAVETLAQGNRGVRYELGLDVDGGVFGASQLETFKVASEAACSTSLSGPTTAEHTPWSSGYSAASTTTTDSWCLVARYAPTRWEHTNTVTVTAPSPIGSGTRTASDSWSANARTTHDPASEPEHSVDVDFEVFGGTP